MSTSVREQFIARYGKEPAVCSFAPGRLEILGNHTDYNEGFVLSCAVSQHTCFAMSPADGTKCNICEHGKDQELDLNDIDTPVKGDWRNYIKGLLVDLKRRGIKFGAFDAVLDSQVPLSAGMSSSAALEMSFAFALKTIYGIELPLADWARVGQAVENKFLGLNSGLLDQFSSLFGKKDSFILCDFRTVEVLKNVGMPSGYVFVVANSMVKHNLVDSAYNQRRVSCENATAAIKKTHPEIKTLRDVSSELLEACKGDMDHIYYLRAKHVVGEDERVFRAVDCLGKDDIAGFGQLLYESHESSRVNFENSCPELDVLVELSKSIPGCLGARLSGGGFGGISIHLVEIDKAESYAERLKTAYKSQTGIDAATFICSIGDGAGIEA